MCAAWRGSAGWLRHARLPSACWLGCMRAGRSPGMRCSAMWSCLTGLMRLCGFLRAWRYRCRPRRAALCARTGTWAGDTPATTSTTAGGLEFVGFRGSQMGSWPVGRDGCSGCRAEAGTGRTPASSGGLCRPNDEQSADVWLSPRRALARDLDAVAAVGTRLYGRVDQGGDLAGAAPRQADAGSTVAVVVD